MMKKLTATAFVIAWATASQAYAQSSQAWKQRPVGGTTVGGTVANGPGPAVYGAQDEANRTVVVYIDGLFPYEPPLAVEISPWYRIKGFNGDRSISYPGIGHVSDDADGVFPNAFTRGLDTIADRLETARKKWLKANGYVGGVRVFTSTSKASQDTAGSALPEPRGIIIIPDEIKRQKTRFRVEANEPTTTSRVVTVRGTSTVRISLPPMMPVTRIHVVKPEAEDEQVAQTEELLASADG